MIKVDTLLGDRFDLEYDVDKRFFKEVIRGKWTLKNYEVYKTLYKEELIGTIDTMYQWCKVVDMREYVISTLNDSIKEHMEWCIERGLVHCIFIVSSPIVKIQMKRIISDVIINSYFYDEDDAMRQLNKILY